MTDENVQRGADSAASLAGFLGQVGTAFSLGYSFGRELDKATGGWISDQLAEDLYKVDQGIRALWDSIHGSERLLKPEKIVEEIEKITKPAGPC